MKMKMKMNFLDDDSCFNEQPTVTQVGLPHFGDISSCAKQRLLGCGQWVVQCGCPLGNMACGPHLTAISWCARRMCAGGWSPSQHCAAIVHIVDFCSTPKCCMCLLYLHAETLFVFTHHRSDMMSRHRAFMHLTPNKTVQHTLCRLPADMQAGTQCCLLTS